MTEEINKLKENLMHPKATTISIKRVPKETSDVFKKFANEEFVGDYGMALKKLVDTVLVDQQPYQHIYAILEDHEKRLCELNGKTEKKIVVRKTLSGKKIILPPKEE